jgi:hypothetical protein
MSAISLVREPLLTANRKDCDIDRSQPSLEDLLLAVTLKPAREPLHPILWQGKQWVVTEFGLQRSDGRCSYEAKQLAELAQQKDRWPWPLFGTIQRGVGSTSSDDFVTAWFAALDAHRIFVPTDELRAVINRYPGAWPPPQTAL